MGTGSGREKPLLRKGRKTALRRRDCSSPNTGKGLVDTVREGKSGKNEESGIHIPCVKQPNLVLYDVLEGRNEGKGGRLKGEVIYV